MKLVNISNHASSKWSEEQKKGFEEIVDIQFPNVSPKAKVEEVEAIAKEIISKVRELDTFDIMVQGEFTLCYLIQREILKHNPNIKIWIPSTERRAVETIVNGTTTTKTSIFEFVGWRII